MFKLHTSSLQVLLCLLFRAVQPLLVDSVSLLTSFQCSKKSSQPKHNSNNNSNTYSNNVDFFHCKYFVQEGLPCPWLNYAELYFCTCYFELKPVPCCMAPVGCTVTQTREAYTEPLSLPKKGALISAVDLKCWQQHCCQKHSNWEPLVTGVMVFALWVALNLQGPRVHWCQLLSLWWENFHLPFGCQHLHWSFQFHVGRYTWILHWILLLLANCKRVKKIKEVCVCVCVLEWVKQRKVFKCMRGRRQLSVPVY